MARMTSMMMAVLLTVSAWVGSVLAAGQRSARELRLEYQKHGYRAAPRDGFPVPHNPDMVPAGEADKKLRDRQWVIGVAHKGEAKAYPVSVMGMHELVNDVIAGHPIAVCW